MAAEDKLSELYQDFVSAKEAKDEAMEVLNEGLKMLRNANNRLDNAILALSEFLGEEMFDEGGDAGDIFSTLTGSAMKLTGSSSISKLFGDLF